MGKRHFKIKDRIKGRDELYGGLRGEVIFGTNRINVPYIDSNGNKAFKSDFENILYVGKNIIPIVGYSFVFSKLFNIGLDQETTLRIGDLNDEAPQMKIGVPRELYKSVHYDAETSISNTGVTINPGVNISALNHIFGFMVGDGGSREDNITAIAPNYKRRSLFRAIPFRMSNDNSFFINGKYYGKQTIQSSSQESVTSYYIKTFDDPKPRVVHSWVSNNPDELNIVDDSVFASTSSIPIESYVEINMSISKDDVRGFFTTTGATARINEFGLVSGWYNAEKDDYETLRLITHFVRPSIILSPNDSVDIIYRLYSR
jgi:hypothetical protein